MKEWVCIFHVTPMSSPKPPRVERPAAPMGKVPVGCMEKGHIFQVKSKVGVWISVLRGPRF